MTTLAEDRIQLKQEEVVGNEVVLNDINPKTNTKSIDDVNSGLPLNELIDKMWNSINNKLSRIVNSVNGRTGVVVLNSSDVGLGNVDNVSLADIKDWVITRMAQEFDNKRIELFESLDDVDNFITESGNDEAYANKPFYSHHGYINGNKPDMRGYIGYIYYDAADGRLKQTNKVLDTVGSTDNSIVYNENVNDKEYSESGRMGVNIWKYEDALEVYNATSGAKNESGLRINKDGIAPKVYFFDGVYGTGDPMDTNALLYFDPSSYPSDTSTMKEVRFKLDGTDLVFSQWGSDYDVKFQGINYIKQSFKINDIIICNFNDDEYLTLIDGSPDKKAIDPYMNPLLVKRNPAIGQVTKAPTLEHPEYDYVIEFFSLRPNLHRGLKEISTHKYSSDFDSTAIGVDILMVDSLKTPDGSTQYPYPENVAGINALSPYDSSYIHVADKTPISAKRSLYTVLPTGKSDDIFAGNDNASQASSLYILPNYSLCVIPADAYSPNNNRIIPNWPMTAPPLGTDLNDLLVENNRSFIGVNLIKKIRYPDEESSVGKAYNISGLRIDDDTRSLDGSWFGHDDPSSTLVETHSGGLSVNVGKFLEIGEPNDSQSDNYYDEGKVNVRIDGTKGLYDPGNSKIAIHLDRGDNVDISSQNVSGGSGLFFDQSVDGALRVNIGLGLKMSRYYPNGKYDSGADFTRSWNKISICLVDSHTAQQDYLFEADDGDGSAKAYYGGLRFINMSKYIANTAIGIRINNSEDEYSTGIRNDSLRIGSEGLKITNENVLGIQFYSKPDYSNPLELKARDAIIVDKIYFPDFDNDGIITSQADPRFILEFYSVESMITTIDGYLDKSTQKFYSDKGHTTEITLEDDKYYLDLTVTPSVIYQYIDGSLTLLKDYQGNDIDETWLKMADINHDGSIDAADASALTMFCDSDYENSITGFKQFLYDEFGIIEKDDTRIMPGLNLRYNEYQGITAKVNGGTITDSTISDTLSIKIRDTSNGYTGTNPTIYGGLRFGTDGILAIRINENNNYSAVTEQGRTSVTPDNLSVGTKGLHIYEDTNVLGIQLTTDGSSDNGSLAFDENGNVIISPNYIPSMEKLTIGDVEYDGTVAKTITIGPGLVLTSD